MYDTDVSTTLVQTSQQMLPSNNADIHVPQRMSYTNSSPLAFHFDYKLVKHLTYLILDGLSQIQVSLTPYIFGFE